MKKNIHLLFFSLIILLMTGCANKPGIEGPKYTVLGGPSSGTFKVFADGIHVRGRATLTN